jgi:hypothetical protein
MTNVLEPLADLTKGCIAIGGISEDAEGTWIAETTDLLLDCWAELQFEHAIGALGSVHFDLCQSRRSHVLFCSNSAFKLIMSSLVWSGRSDD